MTVTAPDDDHKIIHSKEYYRRFQLGEFKSPRDAEKKGYVVDDCVPDTGEHSPELPAYKDALRKRSMVEAARSMFITAQRRGLTIEHLTLVSGATKMAWGKEQTP